MATFYIEYIDIDGNELDAFINAVDKNTASKLFLKSNPKCEILNCFTVKSLVTAEVA